MTREELFEYTEEGHEIEFKFNGIWHSITYWEYDTNVFGFSFCEFDQEPINVKTFDELINLNYKGVTVMKMLETVSEDDFSSTLRIF